MYKKYCIMLGSLFACQASVPELAPAPDDSPECVNQYKGPFTGVRNFKGCKRKDIFLTQVDNYNHLTWSAFIGVVAAPHIPATRFIYLAVEYQIYRVDPISLVEELIATVPGSGILQYDDHNRNPNVDYTYYIVAAGVLGGLSEPAFTTVTEYC
jgi:hypothetical protein